MQATSPEYRAAALIHAARSNIEDALVQFDQFPVEWRPTLRMQQNELLRTAQLLSDIIPAIDAVAGAWQSPPQREDDVDVAQPQHIYAGNPNGGDD